MQFITAAHLAELLGQATADDMQTILRQPLVNLHGNVSPDFLAAVSSETFILLREAALRARNAIEVADRLTDRELEVSLLLQYENAEIGAYRACPCQKQPVQNRRHQQGRPGAASAWLYASPPLQG